MKYNNIILSLALVGFGNVVMGMDKEEVESPETITRTFSYGNSDEGTLLKPAVVKYRELEELEELEELSQQIYSRRQQEGVLLTPQVLKDRAFEQEFYRRKYVGASRKELSRMNHDSQHKDLKKYWKAIKVSQKYLPVNHKKNDNNANDSSDCYRLLLSCFGK